MNKLTIFFTIFILNFSLTFSQQIKFSELGSASRGQYNSYIASDGRTYNIGDKIIIGFPSSNKTFAFIFEGDGILFPLENLKAISSGQQTEISKIFVTGNKRVGYSVNFKTKGYTAISPNYTVLIENALSTGEVKDLIKNTDSTIINPLLNNIKNPSAVDSDKSALMEDSLLAIEEEKHDGHFAGVDFGLNVLLNNSFQANFPNDPQWNNSVINSYYFNFNFYDRKLILTPDRLGVTLGLGLNLSKIAFSDNWTLKDMYSEKDSAVYGNTFKDTISFTRNKLHLAYLQIPILLEFTPKKNVWFSAGFITGIKLSSNVKQLYTDENNPNILYERTIKGTFALNTLKCDATIRAGFGQSFGRMYGAFISYALVPTFNTSVMANVHPLTFGVSYNW
jgi:hypothetical protein